MMLKKYFFNTPFGSVVSVADDNFLYLLQFADADLLKQKLEQIEQNFHTKIIDGATLLTNRIEQELMGYCKGALKEFTIPLFTYGTQFQKQVWNFCSKVEYGKTISYKGLAEDMENRLALRAVGTALAANLHTIVIPCHRIIRSDRAFSGYVAGVEKKLQLLAHEQLFKNMH